MMIKDNTKLGVFVADRNLIRRLEGLNPYRRVIPSPVRCRDEFGSGKKKLNAKEIKKKKALGDRRGDRRLGDIEGKSKPPIQVLEVDGDEEVREPEARPIGVKAAKAVLKRKKSSKELELSKLEALFEIKQKLSNQKILERLIAKQDPLSEMETSLKNKLMSEMLHPKSSTIKVHERNIGPRKSKSIMTSRSLTPQAREFNPKREGIKVITAHRKIT
ncbi:hypothetical protein YC2023_085665 [Brassica napus]